MDKFKEIYANHVLSFNYDRDRNTAIFSKHTYEMKMKGKKRSSTIGYKKEDERKPKEEMAIYV